MDPRTLALGRIVLGLVLIVDLLRRVPWLRDFYSNAGLLPNHTVLWRPPMPRIVLVLLHVVAAGGVGDLVRDLLRLLLLLPDRLADAVLPRAVVRDDDQPAQPDPVRRELGRRGDRRADGVDVLPAARAAVLRRRGAGQPARARRRDAGRAGRRRAARPTTRPRASLAVLGLLLQIAIIYWFNFVHKTGQTWHDGTAVHYVLHQERIVTWLGLRSASTFRTAVTKLLTHGTLVDRGGGAVPDPDADVLALDAAAGDRAAGRAARQHRGDGEPRDLLGRDAAYDPFLIDDGAMEPAGAAGAAQAAGAHRLLRRRLRRLLPDRARAGAAGRAPAPALGLEPRRRAARGVDPELLERTILVV